MNKKLLYSLVLLIFVIVSVSIVILNYKKDNLFYIAIFDSVAILPSNYVFDVASMTSEAVFKSEEGTITVGKGDLKLNNQKIFDYINHEGAIANEICGINYLYSESLSAGLAYDNKYYMIFVNVDKTLQTSILQFVCINR